MRSLLAPAIATALIVGAFSMPSADAAVLTIDDDVCTITYTEGHPNAVVAEAKKLGATIQTLLGIGTGATGADPDSRVMTRAEAAEAVAVHQPRREAFVEVVDQGAPDYLTEAELSFYRKYVLGAVDFERAITAACANGEAGNYPFKSTVSRLPGNSAEGISGLSSNARTF